VNHRSPALSFASKFLNKLLGERGWSAQEVNHILFEIPLSTSSRDVIMLDCRKDKGRPGKMDEEGIKITRSRTPDTWTAKRMLSSLMRRSVKRLETRPIELRVTSLQVRVTSPQVKKKTG
jgi:hypothetical protein